MTGRRGERVAKGRKERAPDRLPEVCRTYRFTTKSIGTARRRCVADGQQKIFLRHFLYSYFFVSVPRIEKLGLYHGGEKQIFVVGIK